MTTARRQPGPPARAADAWIAETSPPRTPDGASLRTSVFGGRPDSPPRTGARGTFGDTAVRLARHDLHADVRHHPGSRYWSLRWLETAVYLTLSGPLTAYGLRRVRRRAS
ncbi:hypothetical protein ABZ714_31085 [Streptomyces sp. NPDC006798]|uniref:hypothetical protein n=1 Tax=Streptomyces sp. NPDC006798 TaxID=3155462 RepID=UPI00340A897E